MIIILKSSLWIMEVIVDPMEVGYLLDFVQLSFSLIVDMFSLDISPGFRSHRANFIF